MLLYYSTVFLLFHSVDLKSLRNERVRNHLQEVDITSRQASIISDELENSNKIGLGYNLISGSPVCYTGECQMLGFTRSIFKLNYTSSVPGSCTNKLVPTNVDLDCLPSTSMKIDSEIIDTIEGLHKSISDKVQVSVGVKIQGVQFSYRYSKETQYMLDILVKKQQISILTKTEISYAKLSMFELTMELSDNFRYVIDNMPCCEENNLDIEEYVKEFIFEYYGFTYVTSILLGGVAQQHITINREAKERLEKQGITITHEATVSFNASKYGAEISVSVSNSQENSNYEKFSKEIQSIRSTTLGGDVLLTSLTNWSKTIPRNPVIIEFALGNIFRLFNSHYFPNDTLITNKSKLIEKVLEKYIANSTYCYNNCGGNGTRGTCEPTGYFQFGICKCKSGWTGPDCETMVESSKILHGTICGFDRSFIRVNCTNQRPWLGCPKGWNQYVWPTDLTICYKNMTEVGDPVYGTLCGLRSYQYGKYFFNHNIGCNAITNSPDGSCPLGYRRYQDSSSTWGSYSTLSTRMNDMCTVTNTKEHLPGTICGMQVQHTTQGPTCNGYNPGLDQCPAEYTSQYTAFNDLGFMVCVKK